MLKTLFLVLSDAPRSFTILLVSLEADLRSSLHLYPYPRVLFHREGSRGSTEDNNSSATWVPDQFQEEQLIITHRSINSLGGSDRHIKGKTFPSTEEGTSNNCHIISKYFGHHVPFISPRLHDLNHQGGPMDEITLERSAVFNSKPGNFQDRKLA